MEVLVQVGKGWELVVFRGGDLPPRVLVGGGAKGVGGRVGSGFGLAEHPDGAGTVQFDQRFVAGVP